MKIDNVLLWNETLRLNTKKFIIHDYGLVFHLRHRSYFVIPLSSDKNVTYMKVASTTIGVYAVLN